jgi:succinate dehydrogenase/fumarate reductase cytochrome b subunit
MALMARPAVRLLELGLVWVVMFHALNGVRLIVLHVVPAANHRTLAFAVGVATVVVGLASLPLFLR